MNRQRWIATLLAGLLPTAALATGMLLPKDEQLPALAIKYQRVDIDIKDGVAAVRLEQVFKNSVNRDLEAVYIFPLPEGAAIADFAMMIDGKRVSGELVEKDKARKIYQDIVRRMRDPGLLEHMGGQLFRVSVYPVPRNGEQKIEIGYSRQLDYDAGMFKFVYPLRTGNKASRTLADFTVGVRLSSSVPIKTVYSPSHKVGISRKGEHAAIIGFEETGSLLDRDFVLYYGVSEKDFGLNLLTHAPAGQDGFFMMMIAPGADADLVKAMPKDIAFVIDTSGSMAGAKIVQARNALKYCIRKLNDEDRFTIVRFSTDVESFERGLLEVTAEIRDKALTFADGLEARGGTDVNGALLAALGVKTDPKRPYIVAFLTDGMPTIGTTDTSSILKNVTAAKGDNARVFVFGVGDDVNTHLLDRIARDAGGASEYVKPHEDIETAVSAFYDKISHPVLSRPRLEVSKVRVRDVYPKELPDLFRGGQVTVFGRYEGHGHVAVTLSGTVDGQKRDVVYESTFAQQSTDNDFIPRLWATRKVGYLLDEIRLHGENKELKDEVIRLSKEYGIMTPYTSYLVLESDAEYARHDIDTRERDGRLVRRDSTRRQWFGPAAPIGGGAVAGGRTESSSGETRASVAIPVFEEARELEQAIRPAAKPGRVRVEGAADAAVHSSFRRQSGREAIRLSEAISHYKGSEVAEDSDTATIRHVGKKIFYHIDGVWVDREYRKGMETKKVVYAGDEYFQLLDQHPDLRSYFALGTKVIVCLDDNTAVEVTVE